MNNGTLVQIIDHLSTAIVYVGFGIGIVILLILDKDATSLFAVIGGFGFKQVTSAAAAGIKNGKILNGNGRAQGS